MSRPLYAKGDTIVLNTGLFRRPAQITACQVTTARLNPYGKTEYHVRFEDEIFDRCITEADIDVAASAASNGTES